MAALEVVGTGTAFRDPRVDLYAEGPFATLSTGPKALDCSAIRTPFAGPEAGGYFQIRSSSSHRRCFQTTDDNVPPRCFRLSYCGVNSVSTWAPPSLFAATRTMSLLETRRPLHAEERTLFDSTNLQLSGDN